MTSNLIPTPNTQLSSEVFTKKASLIARGLNEISLLKPSPESLYQTGMDYYEGSNGKPWDILKAYAYLVKSAEQGFALAQWRLGCMFDGNEAVEKNEEKEVHWREKAALNGNLGAMYWRLSSSSEAYSQELTHLATSGYVKALNALAYHYINGDHKYIKQDMQQAWYWVKRIIEQRCELHSLNLKEVTAEFWDEVDKDNGYWLPDYLLCEERYSVAEREQYYENRMIWLLEKAQQGEVFAQSLLGYELEQISNGEYVFRLDRENWQRLVKKTLLRKQAAIRAMASDEPIAWREIAVFWRTKAAEQGCLVAQFNLNYDGLEKRGCKLLRMSLCRRVAEHAINYNRYFEAILAFNATDSADAPKFTFEELEHYRLTNHDSI